MPNLYREREQGDEAARIINSEVWGEAWQAYRARILEEIEAAPSNGSDTVMHLKRLLAAATAARGHIERIMKEGAVAASVIELEDKRRGLRKLFG